MGGCQTFFIPLSLLWSRSPSLFLVTIWLGALTFLPCSSPPLNLSLSRCVGSRLLSHSLFALWMGAQFLSLISCSLNNKLTTNSSANQSNPTATLFFNLSSARQLVFFPPPLTHPLLSIIASLWLLKCSSPLSRQAEVEEGEGGWGRGGGTAPYFFFLREVSTLAGFPP